MKKEYIEFLQYSLDERKGLPDSFEMIGWQEFMQFCHQQSIIGVVFGGLERTNKSIPQQLLFEWISYVENIKQQNLIVNKSILSLSKWFKNKGCRTVILKGQANGVMYPKPEYRSPGDIDIWVEGEKTDTIRLVLKEFPDAHYSIHHIEMPVFRNVAVEAHYRPIYLINWFKDKKLQKYIDAIEERQFSSKISFDGDQIGCLTYDFNLIYQLLHMYAHLFSSRNNFKQLIDYYYLLRKVDGKADKVEIEKLLRQLDVLKYAKGIMWIMHEILGVEKELLFVVPDEKIGKLLLGETLKYGTYKNRTAKDLIMQTAGNMKLATVFPKNVMISPLFLVWLQWWKFKMTRELKRVKES